MYTNFYRLPNFLFIFCGFPVTFDNRLNASLKIWFENRITQSGWRKRGCSCGIKLRVSVECLKVKTETSFFSVVREPDFRLRVAEWQQDRMKNHPNKGNENGFHFRESTVNQLIFFLCSDVSLRGSTL